MTTLEQAGTGSLSAPAQTRDLVDDRARAERVAAERRRRVALQNLGIRLMALAIALQSNSPPWARNSQTARPPSSTEMNVPRYRLSSTWTCTTLPLCTKPSCPLCSGRSPR